MKKNTTIQKVETKAPAFNIETLINQAVSSNASVDTVERLLAMRKQLRDEWAKQQFDNALASLQGEIPVIEKGQRAGSGSFTYNYAPLEFIISKVKDIIAKYGFSYTFDTAQNGKLKVMCKVKHKAGHTEISEFELAIDTNARMNTSQQYGAALTYGKRYAFCNAFGIVVGGEDTDTVIKQKEIKELENKYIEKINGAKTLNDLAKVGAELKKNIKPDLLSS